MKSHRRHHKKRGTRKNRRGGALWDYFRSKSSSPSYGSVPAAQSCEMEMAPIIRKKDEEIRRLSDELRQADWDSRMDAVKIRSATYKAPTSPYTSTLSPEDQEHLRRQMAANKGGRKHRKSHRKSHRRHSRR